MASAPASLRLTGATVLRDGALQKRSVAIEDGRISKGPLPEVDLRGYFVMPGLIDLQGTGFERHLRLVPGTPPGLRHALRATDREAAAHGITTGWLAHRWSWEDGLHGPVRAEAFARALDSYRGEALTDLRLHIRCETHTTATADRLLALVRRHPVGFVTFTDTLRRVRDLLHGDAAPLALLAAEAGCEVTAYRDAAREALRQRPEVPRYLCRLAEAFDLLGVAYGSHDDADGETREMYAMIGAKICALPAHRSAAALARAVGDPIVLGAPGVVHPPLGAPSPLDLVESRLGDALVSAQSYPSLPQAVFALVDAGVLDLVRGWQMVSSTPAEILRLSDRGVIDYGRRADLAIVNARTRSIEATICGGRITHLVGEAAQRFLGAREAVRLAAE
ncbi:alpha-D-ribose 1-methylphosphonate 5-triphosphate diphosphatase [Pseudoponticoccus marisrubri]|uniref:Alkylphosphonate utilization protein n=1 Tax=Pseudoponticoccus marisrubri TaxID=1685382 RepID=A0A0W7WIZ2_9RHOB|nr:alpha-D-ribose 1-methylphosphonate 5-triphosphate diphosphatase [Pseudoponticoccus marisrubri]KUF10497.1 alkylphosphonate utilization protein [Pseudoponticoccus marisrubri]